MNSLFFKMTMLCTAAIAVLFLGITTASADIPLAPDNITLTVTPANPVGNDYEIALSWTANPGATSYKVYMRVYSANSFPSNSFELYDETKKTTVTMTRSDVQRSVIIFKVTAVNGDGESPYSNAMSSVCGRVWDGDVSQSEGDGLVMIVSNPPMGTQPGQRYQYDANVLADYLHNSTVGDLHFTLTEGPNGMTIDSKTGMIQWTAQNAGAYPVSISVSSSKFSQPQAQSWEVTSAVTTTGIDEETSVQTHRSAFPNPASARTTFRFIAHTGQATAEVTDLHGMEISTRALRTVEGENTFSLDVRNLSSGLYFLCIKGDDTITIPFRIAR